MTIGENIRILKLLKHFGLSAIRLSNKNPQIEYKDKIMFLELNANTDMNDSELMVHNLAHYLCASPERRNLPDFGLGSSPDSILKFKALIPSFDAAEEELMVSLLEGCIYKHLNIKHEKVSKLFNRGSFSEREAFRIQLLQFWGIIDSEKNLTLQRRETPDQILMSKDLFEKYPNDFKGYSQKTLARFAKLRELSQNKT